MELTAQQEADVQKIMATMDCPHGFRCYKSEFEKLVPVKVISSSAIECNKAKESFCPKAISFGMSMMLCRCRLRGYVALELGR